MPVTELGLVAGAGALGLTGHGVGHGCGGRGRGSAAASQHLPGPGTSAVPPSAGQSGQGHQAARRGDTTASSPSLPPLLGIATLFCPRSCCLLHVWFSWAWGWGGILLV